MQLLRAWQEMKVHKRKKALELIDILLKRINFYEINVNMDVSAAKMTYERIIKNETK